MAIETGNTVSVHYTGTLDDGTIFDSSEGRDPLTFEVGSGQLIPGFDRAVLGKGVGETTTVECAPDEAYGDHDDGKILEIKKEQLTGVDAEVGQVLGLTDDDGNPHQATVHEVLDETIKLDFNHFLAGKTLTFEIEVVSIAN
jgi:peptidylprolyl isomerase